MFTHNLVSKFSARFRPISVALGMSQPLVLFELLPHTDFEGQSLSVTAWEACYQIILLSDPETQLDRVGQLRAHRVRRYKERKPMGEHEYMIAEVVDSQSRRSILVKLEKNLRDIQFYWPVEVYTAPTVPNAMSAAAPSSPVVRHPCAFDEFSVVYAWPQASGTRGPRIVENGDFSGAGISLLNLMISANVAHDHRVSENQSSCFVCCTVRILQTHAEDLGCAPKSTSWTKGFLVHRPGVWTLA